MTQKNVMKGLVFGVDWDFWEFERDQWAVCSRQFSVGGGQFAVGSGQLAVAVYSGQSQFTVVSRSFQLTVSDFS